MDQLLVIIGSDINTSALESGKMNLKIDTLSKNIHYEANDCFCFTDEEITK